MAEALPPNAGAEGMPDEMPEVDLSQIRVESLLLNVASELMSIGAGQLGMIPGMVNGGDGVQARLAIGGADALIGAFLEGLPEGTELPEPVQELRRALAELQLAFADAVAHSDSLNAAAGSDGTRSSAGPKPKATPPPPTVPPQPPRPKIWTPGGDV
ncbi:MAG: hypothetical protein CK540_07150 [Thermoleophilia bacterium]|nr:MAG: hypothetical protein CK540_07150 [Thermoleophilia bacterium]